MRTSHTITFKGVDMDVNFNFHPGDPGVHTYSNGDPGYPPTDPEIEINSVFLGPYDITDLVEIYLDDITEILWKERGRNNDY
jgi:hypothetical protein